MSSIKNTEEVNFCLYTRGSENTTLLKKKKNK